MSEYLKKIEVAVGVIKNPEGKILLAKRPADKHMGGLWEFPGGKIEPGETTEAALVRELREEVNLTPTRFEKLIRIEHQYQDKNVVLNALLINQFTGEAFGVEGQEVHWVKSDKLNHYTFPEANKSIITALLLPRQFLITGHFDTLDDFDYRLKKAIDNGITHIQIRAPWLSREKYIDLCRFAYSSVGGAGIKLFANTSTDVHGLSPLTNFHFHLNSINLESVQTRSELRMLGMLSAACHSVTQLEKAQDMGADFVFFAPVLETATHPGREPGGWGMLAEICGRARIPVYALGGMKRCDLERAVLCGAQGIASISAFW